MSFDGLVQNLTWLMENQRRENTGEIFINELQVNSRELDDILNLKLIFMNLYTGVLFNL